MQDETLKVIPVALQAASEVVAGHAQLVLPVKTAGKSVETAGAAAAAFGGAFSGYCGGFSQRLSVASAALLRAASSFTATENVNRAALASIVPQG